MGQAYRSIFALFALASALAGCITASHRPPPELQTGKLTGKVSIAWEDTTDYVYMPYEALPLTFTIPPGYRISDDDQINADEKLREIRPDLMFTDGGSIPRILWSVDGFSPLDYLPAYVIHDWLYMQHRCHGSPVGVYDPKQDFPYSRATVDEILHVSLQRIDEARAKKTGKTRDNSAVHNAIYTAVDKFGKKAWEPDKADCRKPKPDEQTVFVTERLRTPTFDKSGRRTEFATRAVKRSRYNVLVTVSAP